MPEEEDCNTASVGRPERASRRARPIHLPGCHRTRRARAPGFLIIFQSIFMRKNLASSPSLSLSLCLPLLHSLSSKPNPFGGARSQKLSTLYIISLLPPLPLTPLARSHMQHACILSQSPIVELDEVLHISPSSSPPPPPPPPPPRDFLRRSL